MSRSSHTPHTPDFAETHPGAFSIGYDEGELVALFRASKALHASTDEEARGSLSLSATQALAGDMAVMALVQGDGETLCYDGEYIAAAVSGARIAVAEFYEELGVAA